MIYWEVILGQDPAPRHPTEYPMSREEAFARILEEIKGHDARMIADSWTCKETMRHIDDAYFILPNKAVGLREARPI